jgi:hypothetical protein
MLSEKGQEKGQKEKFGNRTHHVPDISSIKSN